MPASIGALSNALYAQHQVHASCNVPHVANTATCQSVRFQAFLPGHTFC